MSDPSSPAGRGQPKSAAPAAAPKGPSSFGELDLGVEETPSGLDLDTGGGSAAKQEYEADELVDLPTAKKPPPASRRVPINYGTAAKAQPEGEERPAARSKPAAPAEPAAPARAQARPRPPRPEEPPEPKRSYAREIKIAILVIVCLGLIGGGVYGFLEWREGVRLAEEAQMNALNKGSLDSLKNDSLNKGKLGT
ncbi:MAG TPA: hypothetical protein PK668_16770 [Myxococcota bacterium]|nr:hypothetical protein [Myxococcota bacterium]HRY94812.1 hypothetical protein [Myxococcota bacterium]HSA22302.1 hypothetical protein [Myxococcota bacterium]